VNAILLGDQDEDAGLFQEAFDASFEWEIYSMLMPSAMKTVSWDVDRVLSGQSPAPPMPTTTQEPEAYVSSAVCVSPSGSVTTLDTNMARETKVTPAKRSLSDDTLSAEDDEAFAER
jgi:hypothetical protein